MVLVPGWHDLPGRVLGTVTRKRFLFRIPEPGWSPAVQTLLGHKSIKITMDIYGHLTPDHLEASINRPPYRKEAPGKVVPLFAGSEIKREPGR